MIRSKKLFTASIVLFLSTGISFASEICSPSISYKTSIIDLDEENAICFSMRPLPVCLSPAIATKSYQKRIKYHCIPKTAPLPPDGYDWSVKAPNYSKNILLAVRCECPNS